MTQARADLIESTLRLFALELISAEAKHPGWPDDIVHQAAIVAEEAGELLQAANDIREHPASASFELGRIRHEAAQVGAMALRLLLNLDGATNGQR